MEKWLKFFIKIFELTKYTIIIKCEGLKSVIRNRKVLKINSFKLEVFIQRDLYKNLICSHNRLLFLKIYYYTHIKSKLRGPKINSTKISALFAEPNKLSYNTKYIYSIGINDYKHFNKLNCAENDALSLTNFFKNKFNFKGDTLLGRDANKYNIEKLFKTDLFNKLTKNDLLVLSFHGHGITLNISNIDYGFIVPINSPIESTPGDLISMNDITNWIKYLNCNHVLILLDCCFSGMSLNTRGLKKSNIVNSCSPKIHKIFNKRNRIIINAGMDDESVADAGWGNNSPFVGAILSYPNYTYTNGSVISLFYYLMSVIPNNYCQIPTLGKLPGDQGGDIFLSI
jgi:hypothetical protein